MASMLTDGTVVGLNEKKQTEAVPEDNQNQDPIPIPEQPEQESWPKTS